MLLLVRFQDLPRLPGQHHVVHRVAGPQVDGLPDPGRTEVIGAVDAQAAEPGLAPHLVDHGHAPGPGLDRNAHEGKPPRLLQGLHITGDVKAAERVPDLEAGKGEHGLLFHGAAAEVLHADVRHRGRRAARGRLAPGGRGEEDVHGEQDRPAAGADHS